MMETPRSLPSHRYTNTETLIIDEFDEYLKMFYIMLHDTMFTNPYV